MFRKKKDANISGDTSTENVMDSKKDINSAGPEDSEEGKKEKKERFFFKQKKEEEDILYDPDIEYIPEEEVNQEEYEKDVRDLEGKKKEKERKKLWRWKKKDEQHAGSAVNSDDSEDSSELYGQETEESSKKFSRKKLAVIIGAAVVVISSAAYFMMKNLSGGAEGKAYVESVKELVELGSASGANNRYTGEVEAQDSWDITLQSDLSVEKCFVKVGDQVKKGDKLFSYNTEELKLSKERKELEIETMENENTQLNKDIKSYKGDLDSSSASEKIELQTEILTAQTTIKKNEYSIKSGKEEVKDLEKKIKDATVTSKMDGVVKKINASLGEGAGGDDTDTDDDMMDTGTDDESTYMSILAVGDYRIKGTVSETNVWSLNEGDPMIIRSRVDDTTWTGTISKINTDDTADSGDDDYSDDMDYMGDGSGSSASNYNFYVELDSDDGLMMGQHVFVEVDNGQDEEKEGIWLPSAYVYIDGDKYYVWLSGSRDRLKLQEITVGEYNENLDEYQILDGIEMDDYIACDTGSLQENMKTTKVASEAEENTKGYYEEETSDDEIYGDDYDGSGYDDMDYDDSDYDDTDYDDTDYSDNIDFSDEGLIDEGFDPAEFE